MASATKRRTPSERGALARLRIDEGSFRAFQARGESDGAASRIVPWFACWASGGHIDR